MEDQIKAEIDVKYCVSAIDKFDPNRSGHSLFQFGLKNISAPSHFADPIHQIK